MRYIVVSKGGRLHGPAYTERKEAVNHMFWHVVKSKWGKAAANSGRELTDPLRRVIIAAEKRGWRVKEAVVTVTER